MVVEFADDDSGTEKENNKSVIEPSLPNYIEDKGVPTFKSSWTIISNRMFFLRFADRNTLYCTKQSLKKKRIYLCTVEVAKHTLLTVATDFFLIRIASINCKNILRISPRVILTIKFLRKNYGNHNEANL